MLAVKTEKYIILSDERKLFFSEQGDVTGTPVIYFHGFPGSRLEADKFHSIAALHHCRLISIDRPGMGLSTIDKKRTLLSTVKDIASLVDHLEIDKFSIVGHSGGAPFVVACAYLMPERLNSSAIVSGLAPLDNPASHVGMLRDQLMANKLVKLFPWLAPSMMRITRMMLNKSDKFLEKMIKPLPEVDQKIFRDSLMRKALINSTLEAFRQGVKGAAYEMSLFLQPWGFELEEVVFPIGIWHGEKDAQVPISHRQLYAEYLSNSTVHVFTEEGHLSLIIHHFERILMTLLKEK